MRFVVDAQLPEALVAALTARGFDAVHVRNVLHPDVDDAAIWRFAAGVAASIVITRDADFSYLAARGATNPRVIWLRIGNCSNVALVTLLIGRLDAILRELDARPIVVVRR